MSWQQILSNFSLSSGYRVIIDQYTTAGVIYFGMAKSGSLKSSAVWAIIRLSQTQAGKINDFEWAAGSGLNFTKVWDNRASYTYQAD